MIRFITALVIGFLSIGTAYSADTMRLMYSIVDNKNNTYSDRYALKWDHDLTNDITVDARASISQNRTTDNLTAAVEFGAAKKFRIDSSNTFYFRPELGSVTPSGSENNYYTGLEIGYITKPFPREKIRLKFDHAWIEGLNNRKTDGTLTRVQATYDLNDRMSFGPRAEFRRGNTESDAITLILTQKF